MKCVCKEKCFIKDPTTGRNARLNPGDVRDFDKCPVSFRPMDNMEDHDIDFAKLSEAELTNIKWKFDDITTFCKDTYNIDLTRTDKADVITQFLDARDRFVPVHNSGIPEAK